METEQIFRNGVTLLAFVMAFYALVARERKTPYIVHSVYEITLLVLFALCCSMFGQILDEYSERWSRRLSAVAILLLSGATIYVLIRIFRERNRHLYFRDDHLFRALPVVRWARAVVKRNRRKETYERNPMSLSANLIASLKASSFLPSSQFETALNTHERAKKLSISAVFEVPTLTKTNELAVDLASRFLRNDCFVQYTSCSRHPSEFLMLLRAEWEKNQTEQKQWKEVMDRVVLVDAYTPHFGFTDSMYDDWTRIAEKACLKVIRSRPSYAGVHTALAKAFNAIKEKDNKTLRSPTLLLFEGCASLIDIESAEQYRIFVRHVLPSERMWGGMFTVFIEAEVSDDNKSVLKASSDMYYSITEKEEL